MRNIIGILFKETAHMVWSLCGPYDTVYDMDRFWFWENKIKRKNNKRYGQFGDSLWEILSVDFSKKLCGIKIVKSFVRQNYYKTRG